MKTTWDPDIAALKLSAEEKNGLQVHRNYSRVFLQNQIELFVSQIDAKTFALTNLENGLDFLANDDLRLIPVISCAFLDIALETMYRKKI